MTSGLTPSENVVRKIAEREGVEPSQLETPLYDVIDPEAVDSLFANACSCERSSDTNLQFLYYGYEVTVESPERVTIEIPTIEPEDGNKGTQESTGE